jgi:hypothetical protein
MGTEAAIVAVNLLNGQFPTTDLIYLMVSNGVAMALFLGEGLLLHKKMKPESPAKQEGKLSQTQRRRQKHRRLRLISSFSSTQPQAQPHVS